MARERIMKNQAQAMSQDKKTTELKQPEITKVDKSGELPDEALDKVTGGATNFNSSRSN
jgi:hypothetical protein